MGFRLNFVAAFASTALVLAPHLVAADIPTATATATPVPATILNYAVGYLAADPSRPRVYATVPSGNIVVVIDTSSLSVVKTIQIGSAPQGLSISADGNKLWVANSGSTTFGIGVVDLNTLTALPSIATPALPFDVKEGPNQRLYVTPATQSGGQNSGIMQIDATTGTFQKYFGGFSVYSAGMLDVTPDRKTLFFGNRGLSPSTLVKYDISTDSPSVVQTNNNVGSNGQSLRVSHNGQFLVFPNGGGNNAYNTYEIPTANIMGINGSFAVGPYPTAAAFSNDDALLYHGSSSQSAVKIFDTKTFNLVGTLPLGSSPGSTGGYDTKDLIVDRSGRWLFVATSFYPQSGDLRVIDVGPPELANLSTRLSVGQGDNALIGGIIVTGNAPKKVAVRAIGPSLSQAGIAGALVDPTLELHDSTGAVIATNDDWQTTQIGGVVTADQAAEIQSRGVAPKQAAESAIIAVLAPGNYTAVVRGKNDTTGVALVESYDLDRTADSKLANISTRGFMESGNVMIGGTIVVGNSAANLLVRALGPSLAASGIANPLADPVLELRDASGTLESSNDDWKSTQQTAIEKTGLAPKADAESAIVATVSPGAHTAIVRAKNNGTGIGLVEIYQLGN